MSRTYVIRAVHPGTSNEGRVVATCQRAGCVNGSFGRILVINIRGRKSSFHIRTRQGGCGQVSGTRCVIVNSIRPIQVPAYPAMTPLRVFG
eukprot:2585452-Prymnesium_polylepis.1